MSEEKNILKYKFNNEVINYYENITNSIHNLKWRVIKNVYANHRAKQIDALAWKN